MKGISPFLHELMTRGRLEKPSSQSGDSSHLSTLGLRPLLHASAFNPPYAHMSPTGDWEECVLCYGNNSLVSPQPHLSLENCLFSDFPFSSGETGYNFQIFNFMIGAIVKPKQISHTFFEAKGPSTPIHTYTYSLYVCVWGGGSVICTCEKVSLITPEHLWASLCP